MSFKKKLAATSFGRFLAQKTSFMDEVVENLVPAKTVDEAVGIAAQLSDMGYRVCLHPLGKASKDVSEIQQNVAVVNDAIELLNEERLEVCVSLMPSEMGYLKSAKNGEGHCRQIGQDFWNRIAARYVEERQGFGEGRKDGELSMLMVHASERVPMQRILALHGALSRADVPSCVTIPAALARSEEDVKALISQSACIRLSMTPLHVHDARSFSDEEMVLDSYMSLARLLLSEDSVIQRVTPIFVVEDEDIAERIKVIAQLDGWRPDQFEFEIPYGVNNALKRKLKGEGYRVRVMLPFGREWWAYFVKREKA